MVRSIPKKILNNMRRIRDYRKTEPSLPDNGRKNVLILVSHLGQGGAQRVISYLVPALADTCNVYVLTAKDYEICYPMDSRAVLLCLPQMDYDRIYCFSAEYLRLVKQKYRIDISLSFLFPMNRLNVLSKGKERILVSERNNPKIAAPEDFQKTCLYYALADHVIFQTREVQSFYGRRTQAHSSILPNPVSVSCPASAVRKRRIVNAGRLHKNKNQEMLIRAFALFLPGHPGYELSIYGDGPLEASLKETAKNLGLEGSVIFHGHVPDIHEQMADAGMFVLSSNTEGMPNILLEAMMMGLPCISTACTGAKEVIRDGVNGLLTALDDPESMAAAMARMAENPDEAERMRQNAMKTAETFQKDKVIEQWKRVILGG